jgi:hypothetical protein
MFRDEEGEQFFLWAWFGLLLTMNGAKRMIKYTKVVKLRNIEEYLYREFLEWRIRASPALIRTCWPKLAAHYPVFGLAQSRSASLTTQSLFLFIFIRLSLHVQLIY